MDYEKIYNSRFKVLRKAYENSEIEKDGKFKKFAEKNAYWLEDYALFMALKNSYDGKSFLEWDEDIKRRKPEAMEEAKKQYADEILFFKFQQYEFAKQWEGLKKYANEKGIEIIGDIPIYVALDSADTWANPELFQFDKDGMPIGVAGCPPDSLRQHLTEGI